MTSPAAEPFMGARCSGIVIDGVVEKTTHLFYSPEAAAHIVTDLQHYAARLDTELPTARLLSADAYRLPDDRCVVRHTQEYVPGTVLHELVGEARRSAVREAIGGIAGMSTLRATGQLATPIDAWSGNFVAEASTGRVRFVDFMPPMVRRSDGSFAAPGVGAFDRIAVSNKIVAVARLLRSMNIRSGAPSAELHEMLPDEIRGWQRDAIRALLMGNCLPYKLASGIGNRCLGSS